MRSCELHDAGRIGYAEALLLQEQLVGKRKKELIPDQLLFVEHPHVITCGRNARPENLLMSEEGFRSAGIDFHHTKRGGDVTYHGPGQLVGYPILDLREWKRDVVAYLRALESTIIGALASLGVQGEREPGATGVWADGAKLAAIGVHISRWITCHGFALNVTTDLDYFRLIVPCGLARPVTSMATLGATTNREEIKAALVSEFSRQFGFEIVELQPPSAALQVAQA